MLLREASAGNRWISGVRRRSSIRTGFAAQPRGHDPHDFHGKKRRLLDQNRESSEINDRNLAGRARYRRGAARLVINQGQFAENPAFPDCFEHLTAQHDIDFAFNHREHGVARVALRENGLTGFDWPDLLFALEKIESRHGFGPVDFMANISESIGFRIAIPRI